MGTRAVFACRTVSPGSSAVIAKRAPDARQGQVGAQLGTDEIVIHWPVPDSIFANDLTVFEQIATEGLAQLG